MVSQPAGSMTGKSQISVQGKYTAKKGIRYLLFPPGLLPACRLPSRRVGSYGPDPGKPIPAHF